MALTAKMEMFALGVASGLSQTEAYRRAYNAENMKPAVIAVKASELLRNGNVAVRLTELRAPALQKAQVTAEGVARRAWEIAQQDKPDRVAALNVLSKMFPEFSEKHDIRAEILSLVVSEGKL